MRTIGVGLKWLLPISIGVAACAPARIDLEPAVRQRLPLASAVHVVVYPSDAPGLLTATAIGTASLFGPLGGAVAGARAASVGKELMDKHNVESLSVQLADKLSDDLKSTLPALRRATDVPASLLYNARVRLVDTEQPRILWQGVCHLTGADDPAQAPTVDELEAPGGVAYRRLIADATSACAADLLEQFLGQATPAG